jgi:PAS domain S-box-containing protein
MQENVVPMAHRSVVNAMRDSVVVLDRDFRIIDLNLAARDLFGATGSTMLGRPIGQVWPEWSEQADQFGDEVESQREVTVELNGETHIFDVQSSPLTDRQDRVLSHVVVLRDITPRVLAGEKTKRDARELARSNTLITALAQVAVRVGTSLDLDEILETVGTELRQLNMTCLVALREPDSDALVIYYTSIEPRFLTLGEKLIGIKMVGHQISREQFPMWDQIMNQRVPYYAPDAIPLIMGGIPGVLRPTMEHLFRLMSDGVLDTRVVWLPLSVENEAKGGLAVWGPGLRAEDIPALAGFASQVAVTIESTRLRTAERQQSEQIKSALEEKEILLREIHHRVKNNLQIISSLLSLQMIQSEESGIARMLQDSRSRVRAMALIHEKLYQSEDLARVPMAGYLQDLGRHLFSSYGVDSKHIVLRIDARDTALDVDTAIPCGLIVNELISNSLKHAFPGKEGGEIHVAVRLEEGGLGVLSVCDSGIGLPDDFDICDTQTLGLRLVSTLARQIDGTIKVDGKRGAAFQLTFRPSEPRIGEGI